MGTWQYGQVLLEPVVTPLELTVQAPYQPAAPVAPTFFGVFSQPQTLTYPLLNLTVQPPYQPTTPIVSPMPVFFFTLPPSILAYLLMNNYVPVIFIIPIIPRMYPLFGQEHDDEQREETVSTYRAARFV
jgi:hypothetical protein